MLPTDSELDQMRSDLEGLTLPDSCTVYRVSYAADGGGGQTETWAVSGTAACRLDYKTGQIGLAGGGYDSFSQVMLTVPYDTDVTTIDRILYNDEYYGIKSVSYGSWRLHKRVELEKET